MSGALGFLSFVGLATLVLSPITFSRCGCDDRWLNMGAWILWGKRVADNDSTNACKKVCEVHRSFLPFLKSYNQMIQDTFLRETLSAYSHLVLDGALKTITERRQQEMSRRALPKNTKREEDPSIKNKDVQNEQKKKPIQGEA